MVNTTIKKNTKEKKDDDKKVENKKPTHPLVKGIRITEKSSISADKGQYTFNVASDASKNEIKKAISLLYKVTPVKITMTKIASKKVVRRGVIGHKSGGKKAVVYLKKGDKIEFV
ncbi:MAG: 50S ribosomal protein L23 [Candidatus Pacebacteria bacterium]|nr:50S ribosomal protein L23 [Candidatus Paceibacterota bacterium]